jgi:ABC-2 type transport system permease protein
MRLFRSEFLRARSRRLVPMVIVGGLVGIVIGLGIAAITADQPSAASIAQAQHQYDKQYQNCLDNTTSADLASVTEYSSVEEFCAANSGPYVDGILLRDLGQILQGISTFVILLGVLLGASLGGADWTSNTMTTLLTWEPRRARVFFTRALVIGLFVGAITLFLQVAFSLTFWLVAATRGVTAFLPADLFSDVAGVMLRITAMGIALGLVAYVIAMIGHSTVSSLGALFGYLILFEGVIAGFRESIQGSLLIRAATVVISRHPIVAYPHDFVYSGSGLSAAPPPNVLMDVPKAWAVVAIYVLVLGGLSLIQYQRRDVT